MSTDPLARTDLMPPDAPERLSALLDGECSAIEVATFARRWRGDLELQQRWAAYQLIGDALRSDDLCHPCPPGDAFMAGLRERLAKEPTVLAPLPPVRRLSRARWMRPVGAAAGVMAVAGSVWLLPVRQGGPLGTASQLAATQQTVRSVAVTPVNDPPRAATQQWNRYLTAHQQFPAAAAAIPVSGYLRPAEHDGSNDH